MQIFLGGEEVSMREPLRPIPEALPKLMLEELPIPE